MLKTISNHPGVIHSRFLIQNIRRVVFADHYRKIAGWIKKYLIAAYAENRFQRNWFTMT
jgi:hypothetical protein